MSKSPPRTSENPRILVVRNDGMGDFILTLPLVAAIRSQLPGARITGLISRAMEGLLPLLADFDDAIPDDGFLLKRHWRDRPKEEIRAGREKLLEQIREKDFDMALVVYGESASAALVHQAGIPVRIGSLRRSFFWRFNRFYRESRKGSTLPEFELNLGFLPLMGLNRAFHFPVLRALPPSPLDIPSKQYYVMHPYKRSGTANSWPLENFARLAQTMGKNRAEIVVVGDVEDEPVLHQHFGEMGHVRIITGNSLADLAAMLGGASLFLGNSSGPLHLAALVGTPHIGFFPQNRVSSPDRWRTLPSPGAPLDHRQYLLSPDFPRRCVRCSGPRCPYFNCLEAIDLDDLSAAFGVWGAEKVFKGEKATP